MPPRQVEPIPIAIIGVGLVGAEFISQLLSLPSPSPFRLVYISSSQKSLYSSSGLCFSESGWRSDLSASVTKPDITLLVEELSALPQGSCPALLVDNTSDGDIAALYPRILRGGIRVVTPNKKAFSGELSLFKDIFSASKESGARVLFESTVGAGLPIVSTLKDMVATGDRILKIEGVFSGTLSYIFNEFSKSSPDAQEPKFSSVVVKARKLGYTEPHPADDLSGIDVARKLTILSRLVPELVSSLPSGYRSVETRSLVPVELGGVETGDEFIRRLPEFDAEFDEMRAEARKEGKVLRFVGVIDVDRQVVKAALERYTTSHPFATSLGGSDNIITFYTTRYGARPLIVQGAGAGAGVTAMGVLSDCLKLAD